MKITKMPDTIDADAIMRNNIKEKYSVCPMCGESRKGKWFSSSKYGVVNVPISRFPHRYGKQKPWYKHLFEPSYFWDVLFFKCNTCGAEWESEEFPIYLNEEQCKTIERKLYEQH